MRRRRMELARPPTKSSSIPCSGGNLLERLFGVDDGQRHEDGARPRRDFVDIEVEPVGKEDDLRRDGGDGVVVVLAERAEIHLGEGVARDDAAVGQNPLAAFGQARIVGADAHELGREVALDGERDVAGTAGIDAPAAVFVLVAHHLGEGALEAAGIAALEQRVQKDVVGFEHGIGFELAAPVAVRMLLREKVLRASVRSRSRLRPGPRRCGQILALPDAGLRCDSCDRLMRSFKCLCCLAGERRSPSCSIAAIWNAFRNCSPTHCKIVQGRTSSLRPAVLGLPRELRADLYAR